MILRVGWNCRSVYEFGQHTTIGLDSGLTEAEITALTRDPADGGWSDRDRALIALADDLCADDCVSDATWAALRPDWDDRQLVELIVTARLLPDGVGLPEQRRGQLDDGVPGWPALAAA
ncbi:MAG: hypothetical protein R2755_00645 [Acidimicrobiales bacterium]